MKDCLNKKIIYRGQVKKNGTGFAKAILFLFQGNFY